MSTGLSRYWKRYENGVQERANDALTERGRDHHQEKQEGILSSDKADRMDLFTCVVEAFALLHCATSVSRNSKCSLMASGLWVLFRRREQPAPLSVRCLLHSLHRTRHSISRCSPEQKLERIARSPAEKNLVRGCPIASPLRAPGSNRSLRSANSRLALRCRCS